VSLQHHRRAIIHSRHDSGAFTSYQSNRVEGTVSAYVAGTSISILSKDSTTPVVYALTTATTITGLAAGATLASPDRVVLELSTTTAGDRDLDQGEDPCAAKSREPFRPTSRARQSRS